MSNLSASIEAALLTGSRARNFGGKIAELCKSLPETQDALSDDDRAEILKLAALCRAGKAVTKVISSGDVPAMAEVPDFHDLFCATYYPVLEDGKRTVGFWSVKDGTTLSPADVHEWVRGTKTDKKTGKTEAVAIPFANWWSTNRPDYELYRVASDRAAWKSKTFELNGRQCVNTHYGTPPVAMKEPPKFGTGAEAEDILDFLLERTITDPDPENAHRKRQNFVLDVGAHLLALRDGGMFRCVKLFCFASTNGGQGSGKSILHESIAALVPRDASLVVPTTVLSTSNLLPLYGASVCILTEAPASANERYTAETIKSFVDAGWKNAEEKFVARRAVKDNALKLLASNHLAPLPVDGPNSRRFEFFVSIPVTDGGTTLHRTLNKIQTKMRWNDEELRACVGWALLMRAQQFLIEDGRPSSVARRTISAEHILSAVDYDYFVMTADRNADSYSSYRDWRTDNGFSWSVDAFKFKELAMLSRSGDNWLAEEDPDDEPPPEPEPEPEPPTEDPPEEPEKKEAKPCTYVSAADGVQFKARMQTAYLEKHRMSFTELWKYVTTDKELEKNTAGVRAGTMNKRRCLRQIFPGVVFERFTRVANIVGFNGLVHVDFDHIADKGNGITPAQVRDTLAEMPGFVIGALSSRGDGAWAVFNAGDGIKDYETYSAAERSIFALTEERMCMESDHNLERPTWGRALAFDPDCKIADEVFGGVLPEPFEWKAPTFAVTNVRLTANRQEDETDAMTKVRNERFLEKVVEKACERIQNAADGERHGTAVKAVANVVFVCSERGVQPLSSWGRRMRDACLSCGLDAGETNGIMQYWRQKTGLAG